MTVSPKIRRLSDKIVEAVDVAVKHGRTDIAAELRDVQRALLVQERERQELCRDTDEPDFVASGLRHKANPSALPDAAKALIERDIERLPEVHLIGLGDRPRRK